MMMKASEVRAMSVAQLNEKLDAHLPVCRRIRHGGEQLD